MNSYQKYSETLILNDFQKNKTIINTEIIENDLREQDFNLGAFFNVIFNLSILNNTSMQYLKAQTIQFMQCDLKSINFTNSLLDKMIFQNSILIQANFSQSRLKDSVMQNCSAHGIYFENAHVANCLFEDSEMYKLKIYHSLFIKNIFSSTVAATSLLLNRSHFENSVFVDCSLLGCNLSNITCCNTLFIHCDFTDSFFDSALMENCQFISCKGINNNKIWQKNT